MISENTASQYLFVMTFLFGTALAWPDAAGQENLPSVDQVIKDYDSDQDGALSRVELANSRFARQFNRWDGDQNGKVTVAEIIRYRARFGIGKDGRPIKSKQPEWSVPKLEEMTRVAPGQRASAQQRQQSAFLLATKPHEIAGSRYGILTDHTEDEFLESLKRLAQHRDAIWISVPDLSELHSNQADFDRVQDDLRRHGIGMLAIAPRIKTFGENTVLAMWKLLSSLDADPELDVMPGFLVASNAESFAKLIDQSILYKPITADQRSPLAISQVSSNTETRSLQKAAVLRQFFKREEIETPIAAIYNPRSTSAPRLTGARTWNLTTSANRSFVSDFPPGLEKAFADSNLIIMHGHGIPGMSCSVDITALPDDMTGKVLLTGSCFSAAPMVSDLPQMNQAPGGYEVQQRDAFIMRAIDQGAVVAFGHQRLSQGFPHLYPVLESWMAGETVGTGYQELVNALINYHGFRKDDYIEAKPPKRPRQNVLLYVVIGDPALQLFSKP